MVLTYLLRELGTAGALEGRRVVFKSKVTGQQIEDRVKSYVGVRPVPVVRPTRHSAREGRPHRDARVRRVRSAPTRESGEESRESRGSAARRRQSLRAHDPRNRKEG